jgi:hypothetical protein
MTPEAPTTPLAAVPVADSLGNFPTPWYLYFTAVTRRLGVLRDAVMGWASLTHQGRLVAVTAEGEIGESDIDTSDVVLGAANLTNAGAIPKVSATPGTLDESAITDDGTDILLPARGLRAGQNVAVGQAVDAAHGLVFGGVIVASGGLARVITTGAGVTLKAAADADVLSGILINPTFDDDAHAGVVHYAANVTSAAPSRFNGNVGFGNNAAPGYAVDATGDANVSGVYRVAGAAGVTGSLVLNVTTNTINYKDHAGVNQSMVVVTGVTLTANAFTGGIRTT